MPRMTCVMFEPEICHHKCDWPPFQYEWVQALRKRWLDDGDASQLVSFFVDVVVLVACGDCCNILKNSFFVISEIPL